LLSRLKEENKADGIDSEEYDVIANEPEEQTPRKAGSSQTSTETPCNTANPGCNDIRRTKIRIPIIKIPERIKVGLSDVIVSETTTSISP